MDGKELVIQTYKHQDVERAPWVPFAGVHAGKLVGYSAKEVLLDEEKLFRALMEVNKLYQPDGQPVMFDLQIEAEILGCDLMWADFVPPSVASHPLRDTSVMMEKTISKEDGRIPMVLRTMKRMKEAVGDTTALYGLFCGPLTLASHLRGTPLFLDMVLDSDYVHKLMAYTTGVAKTMAGFYIEAGMDIIAPVDPLVSQISPKHFQQYLSQPYQEIFSYIQRQKRFSSFFVCGNAIKNIEEMCQTGPDAIFIDENIDMAQAKIITDGYDIVLGGNIPLTTTMLFGTQQDNMKFVVDLLEKVGTKNLVISPGCDMPYDVPVANTVAAAQAVRYPDKARQLIDGYTSKSFDAVIDVPDYAHLKRPLIELFTLDPKTCAACTYMLASVEEVKSKLGEEKYDWGDYRYNNIKDIARMSKVGVKNLPSIYINGELVFDSLIPTQEELMKAIERVC